MGGGVEKKSKTNAIENGVSLHSAAQTRLFRLCFVRKTTNGPQRRSKLQNTQSAGALKNFVQYGRAIN